MTADTAQISGPTGGVGRFESLDVLRGVAVLGIFAINIWFMGKPEAFYTNPNALGPLDETSKLVWTIIYFLVAFKFITLFSMMFGGGIAMMAERAGGGKHMRRMFWLLLFGLAHAYLIWPGDILVTYAICGMLITGARNWSPRGLMIFATFMLLLGSALGFLWIYSLNFAPADALADVKADIWTPSAESIEDEVAQRLRPGFFDQVETNFNIAIFFQTASLIMQVMWRTLGVMALGMALYKWGVLTGQRSMMFYLVWLVIGFGVGMPLVWQAIAVREASDWALIEVMSTGEFWNYWGSLFMAMGWLSLVMLFAKSGILGFIRRSFAATGRMAFTNYIMQSLIGTGIFFGWGLGLFNQLSLLELVWITLGVWLFQLILSPIWLSLFQFGPLEWLWRSLTYGRLAPFRRQTA